MILIHYLLLVSFSMGTLIFVRKQLKELNICRSLEFFKWQFTLFVICAAIVDLNVLAYVISTLVEAWMFGLLIVAFVIGCLALVFIIREEINTTQKIIKKCQESKMILTFYVIEWVTMSFILGQISVAVLKSK